MSVSPFTNPLASSVTDVPVSVFASPIASFAITDNNVLNGSSTFSSINDSLMIETSTFSDFNISSPNNNSYVGSGFSLTTLESLSVPNNSFTTSNMFINSDASELSQTTSVETRVSTDETVIANVSFSNSDFSNNPLSTYAAIDGSSFSNSITVIYNITNANNTPNIHAASDGTTVFNTSIVTISTIKTNSSSSIEAIDSTVSNNNSVVLSATNADNLSSTQAAFATKGSTSKGSTVFNTTGDSFVSNTLDGSTVYKTNIGMFSETNAYNLSNTRIATDTSTISNANTVMLSTTNADNLSSTQAVFASTVSNSLTVTLSEPNTFTKNITKHDTSPATLIITKFVTTAVAFLLNTSLQTNFPNDTHVYASSTIAFTNFVIRSNFTNNESVVLNNATSMPSANNTGLSTSAFAIVLSSVASQMTEKSNNVTVTDFSEGTTTFTSIESSNESSVNITTISSFLPDTSLSLNLTTFSIAHVNTTDIWTTLNDNATEVSNFTGNFTELPGITTEPLTTTKLVLNTSDAYQPYWVTMSMQMNYL